MVIPIRRMGGYAALQDEHTSHQEKKADDDQIAMMIRDDR